MNKSTKNQATRLVRIKGNKLGQTLAEYAMILAFVSVVAITTLLTLGKAADNSKITVTHQLAIAQASH